MVTPLISSPYDREVEHEADLWSALTQDDSGSAREALFMMHAPFARSLARRHHRQRNRGDIDCADVEQLAFEALLEAIGRFDPQRGVPFRAFATRRITGNIVDGMRRMTEVREQLSWQHRMRRDRIHSLSASGEAASLEQALGALGDLAVGLALGFMMEGTGLYIDESEPANIVSAPSAASAYESAAWKELTGQLAYEVAGLDTRERTILQLHYMQGMAFEHLATLLSLSKGRISQIHRNALVKLQKRLSAKGQFRLER